LKYVNRQATRRAAKAKHVPLIIDQQDIADAKNGDLSGIRIPYVGERTPRGWRQVNIVEWFHKGEELEGYVRRGVYTYNGKGAFFVDKSGFGAPGEPALNLEEFLDLIRPGYGYGVIEEGQFQVHVAVFERSAKRPQFYACGICDHYHNALWNGDCRQDDARFFVDQLDNRYGVDGWVEVPMPE
jgi:hypothetical protein